MQKITLVLDHEINRVHRAEKHFTRSILCLTGSGAEIKTLIEARIYETASRAYVCIWVNVPDGYTSASAMAGGYGYSRRNAAIVMAANKLGFQLKEGPDVRVQVEYMALQLGLDQSQFKIIEAYG